MTATAARPLLRGPGRSFVFEPAPTRCLVVDVPVAAMKAAVSAAGARLPGHASIDAAPAAAVIRLATRLAAAANRSRSLAALQRFSARDRAARMPEPIRKLEDQLLDVLVHAAGSAAFQRRSPSDHCDVEALKAWLAARAHGPVRMTELATRAGVSKRTVERAFLRTRLHTAGIPAGRAAGTRTADARGGLLRHHGGRSCGAGWLHTPGPIRDGVSAPVR